MASKIIYKDDALDYIRTYGSEAFLDKASREKFVILERPIDITIAHWKQFQNFGDIRLEYRGDNNSIELWIGGQKRYTQLGEP